VQHLITNIVKPARAKRDSQQAATHVDHLLFKLVEEMHSTWHFSQITAQNLLLLFN